MNKKGFTLVEVVSVVALLAIMMIVVATKGFGAFDNAKLKISNENKKTIIEGSKILLLDLDYCDTNSDIDNLLKDNSSSCQHINEYKTIKEKLNTNSCDNSFDFSAFSIITSCDIYTNNQELEIKLKDLIKYNYVTGDAIENIEKEYKEQNGTEYFVKINLDGEITLP